MRRFIGNSFILLLAFMCLLSGSIFVMADIQNEEGLKPVFKLVIPFSSLYVYKGHDAEIIKHLNMLSVDAAAASSIIINPEPVGPQQSVEQSIDKVFNIENMAMGNELTIDYFLPNPHFQYKYKSANNGVEYQCTSTFEETASGQYKSIFFSPDGSKDYSLYRVGNNEIEEYETGFSIPYSEYGESNVIEGKNVVFKQVAPGMGWTGKYKVKDSWDNISEYSCTYTFLEFSVETILGRQVQVAKIAYSSECKVIYESEWAEWGVISYIASGEEWYAKGVGLVRHKGINISFWNNETHISEHDTNIAGYTGNGDPFIIEDEDSDKILYVKNLLKHSLVNADSKSKESIQNAIYNLLFKAQYRPTKSTIQGDTMKYTGTLAVNKTWPVQNKDVCARSVYDKVLGQIKFTEGAAGCMSYALFATAYTYGTSGTAKMCEDRTASGIKEHLHRYVDPGEQIRYRHPTNNHSIVFLGESGNGEGFYYISYDGGKTSTGGESHGLYVGYQTYNDFARKVTTSLSVRDTNGGSYYKGETVKSVEKVRTGVGATSMVLRLECPVEAIIKLGNEILDSQNPGRTSFGIVEKIEDQIIFKVDYNEDYELIINGEDEGNMTLTLEYYTDDTQIDKRTFVDFPIESTTQITSGGFDPQASFVLYSDIGTPNEQTWGAGKNETVYDTDIDFSSTYNAADDDTSINFIEWDPGEEKIVEKDKIWTIKFNAKVDENTLKDNIYVEDKNNIKQNISISLDKHGQSVLVSPPNGGYKNGREYTLYITNEIKDESGRQLAKPIKMKFSITKH